MNPRSLLAGAGLLLVLAFTGCQSSAPAGAPAPTATPEPPKRSVEELVKASYAATSAVKSYHFTGSMNMNMDMGGMSMTIPMEMSGDFSAPANFKAVMEMKAPLQMKMEMVSVNGKSYMKNPATGQWEGVSSTSDATPFSPSDFNAMFKALPVKAEDRGMDTVGGTATRRVAYALSGQSLSDMVALFGAGSGMTIKDAKVEAWVSESDLFTRRMVMDMAMEMPSPMEASTKLGATVKMDMTMSDFNKPVDIVAPEVTGSRSSLR